MLLVVAADPATILLFQAVLRRHHLDFIFVIYDHRSFFLLMYATWFSFFGGGITPLIIPKFCLGFPGTTVKGGFILYPGDRDSHADLGGGSGRAGGDWTPIGRNISPLGMGRGKHFLP